MAVVSNGTTIIDAGALGSGVATGKMTLIKTLTASSSANLSFVDGAASVVLDDTYDSYVFKFIDIHPSASGESLEFNLSTDSGSNYNVAKTTTFFVAAHSEDDTSEAQIEYRTAQDLAQGTGFQPIHWNTTNSNDDCSVGTLHLFNPSSTVFVKHFIATANIVYSKNLFIAGYGNTTSAVDAVRFQMSSGNIDAGVIKLYGIGG